MSNSTLVFGFLASTQLNANAYRVLRNVRSDLENPTTGTKCDVGREDTEAC